MSEQDVLREALAYGTAVVVASAPADRVPNTGDESPPVGLGPGSSGETPLPEIMARRMCSRPGHRIWGFWADDGGIVCGLCHPPVNARWLRHGGPALTLPSLGPQAIVTEPLQVPKVLAMGTGPGPRNVLVELADGTKQVVTQKQWQYRLSRGERKNDESPPPEPPKRLRRGAVAAGQGSLLG